jgi:Translation initiation factor 1A / IF-1
MRKNRIRVLAGDKVLVEMTPYGLTKGRIADAAHGSKYDANAGIRSYAEMLDENPDLVLAFPGNKGTRDMLRRAEEAKKKGMPIDIKKARLVELHYLAAISATFVEPPG